MTTSTQRCLIISTLSPPKKGSLKPYFNGDLKKSAATTIMGSLRLDGGLPVDWLVFKPGSNMDSLSDDEGLYVLFNNGIYEKSDGLASHKYDTIVFAYLGNDTTTNAIISKILNKYASTDAYEINIYIYILKQNRTRHQDDLVINMEFTPGNGVEYYKNTIVMPTTHVHINFTQKIVVNYDPKFITFVITLKGMDDMITKYTPTGDITLFEINDGSQDENKLENDVYRRYLEIKKTNNLINNFVVDNLGEEYEERIVPLITRFCNSGTFVHIREGNTGLIEMMDDGHLLIARNSHGSEGTDDDDGNNVLELKKVGIVGEFHMYFTQGIEPNTAINETAEIADDPPEVNGYTSELLQVPAPESTNIPKLPQAPAPELPKSPEAQRNAPIQIGNPKKTNINLGELFGSQYVGSLPGIDENDSHASQTILNSSYEPGFWLPNPNENGRLWHSQQSNSQQGNPPQVSIPIQPKIPTNPIRTQLVLPEMPTNKTLHVIYDGIKNLLTIGVT
jgi:hypothetical protein